jgi:hypothetical protein
MLRQALEVVGAAASSVANSVKRLASVDQEANVGVEEVPVRVVNPMRSAMCEWETQMVVMLDCQRDVMTKLTASEARLSELNLCVGEKEACLKEASEKIEKMLNKATRDGKAIIERAEADGAEIVAKAEAKGKEVVELAAGEAALKLAFACAKAKEIGVKRRAMEFDGEDEVQRVKGMMKRAREEKMWEAAADGFKCHHDGEHGEAQSMCAVCLQSM